MQPVTNLLINASRKAVKFLQRDFLELEMLQESSKGTIDFCNKSYIKVQNLLRDELQKYTSSLFFPEDKFDINAPSKPTSDMVLLINPLDNLTNLERSIPFFAVSITSLKNIDGAWVTTSIIINLPALDKIYYIEKGKGVWLINNITNTNNRSRVSGRYNLNNLLVATDDLNINQALLKNVRVFASHCYAILLFASGKIDVVYFSSLNYTLKIGFNLIVRESGGVIIDDKTAFIATNYESAKKIKHLLTEKIS